MLPEEPGIMLPEEGMLPEERGGGSRNNGPGGAFASSALSNPTRLVTRAVFIGVLAPVQSCVTLSVHALQCNYASCRHPKLFHSRTS